MRRNWSTCGKPPVPSCDLIQSHALLLGIEPRAVMVRGLRIGPVRQPKNKLSPDKYCRKSYMYQLLSYYCQVTEYTGQAAKVYMKIIVKMPSYHILRLCFQPTTDVLFVSLQT